MNPTRRSLLLTPHPFDRADLLPFAIILSLAAAVRLFMLSTAPFQYDESLLTLSALDMTRHGIIPLIGQPTSIGVPTAPMSNYLLAIPFALSSNPLVAMVFIALVNIGGVGLLWAVAQRYAGRTVALVAGLVYACSPWAIFYSRKIWQPDLNAPLLLTAFALALYGYLEQGSGRRWRVQILTWPLLVFAIQIHFAGWVLLPVFVAILWLGRRNTRLRIIALGFALAVLTQVPYAVGLARSLYDNPALVNAVNAQPTAPKTLSFSPLAAQIVAQFATGLNMNNQAGFTSERLAVEPPGALWLLIGVCTLTGVLCIFRREHRLLAALATGWVVCITLAFTPNWTLPYPHYFVAVLPMLALLAGFGVQFATDLLRAEQARRAAGVALTGILCIVLGSQVLWWVQLTRNVDVNETRSDLNLPIRYLLDIRERLAAAQTVVLATNNWWSEYAQEPTIWKALLYDSAVCLRAVGSDDFAIFPPRPFTVLISPRAGPNPADGNYSGAQDAQTIPLRAGEGQYTLGTFDAPLAWTGPTLLDTTPVRFDSGVTLTGYQITAARVTLRWHIERHDVEEFQYFAHVLNEKGDRVAQRDAKFLPGHSWCPGDDLVTWIDLDIPAGVRTLRIGLYRIGLGREDGRIFPASTTDAAGNLTGNWIDIALP